MPFVHRVLSENGISPVIMSKQNMQCGHSLSLKKFRPLKLFEKDQNTAQEKYINFSDKVKNMYFCNNFQHEILMYI